MHDDYRCPNCGWTGDERDASPIQDIHERLEPGDIYPAGECPKCGALVEPVADEAESAAENTNCLEGLRCQKCGSLGPFHIASTCKAVWEDDGTGDVAEFDFDDESHAFCPKCVSVGTVGSLLKPPQPPDDDWRRAAIAEYADADRLNIDPDAKVSHGEESGAWVAAWVWVDGLEESTP